jgi:hypothetical protein
MQNYLNDPRVLSPFFRENLLTSLRNHFERLCMKNINTLSLGPKESYKALNISILAILDPLIKNPSEINQLILDKECMNDLVKISENSNNMINRLRESSNGVLIDVSDEDIKSILEHTLEGCINDYNYKQITMR